MTNNDFNNAFKQLESLNEADFNLSASNREEIEDFLSDDEVNDSAIKVVDLDAEDEKELDSNNVGKIILQCPCCETIVMKNADEIDLPDDCDEISDCNVQVGEQCPICFSEEGYKIIGKVAPLEEVTVEITPKDDEESEDDEDSDKEEKESDSSENEDDDSEENEEESDDTDEDKKIDEDLGGAGIGAVTGRAFGTGSGTLAGAGIGGAVGGVPGALLGGLIGAGVGSGVGSLVGGAAGDKMTEDSEDKEAKSNDTETKDESLDESSTDKAFDLAGKVVDKVGDALNTAVGSSSVLNGENTGKNVGSVGKAIADIKTGGAVSSLEAATKKSEDESEKDESLNEDIYRQYEDPYQLEQKLKEAKERFSQAKAEGADDDTLISIAETISNLEQRVNFAWQDDEFDSDIGNESLNEKDSIDEIEYMSPIEPDSEEAEQLDETVAGTALGAIGGVAANKIKHPILSRIPIVGTISNIGAGIKGAALGSGVSNLISGEGDGIANGIKIGYGLGGGLKGAALGALGGAVLNDIQNDGQLNLNGLKGKTLETETESLNENDESDMAKCDWCDEEFEKSELHNTDIGHLCEDCIEAIRSRGEKVADYGRCTDEDFINEACQSEQYLCSSEDQTEDSVDEGFGTAMVSVGKFLVSHWSDIVQVLAAIGVTISELKKLQKPDVEDIEDNSSESEKIEEPIAEAFDVKVPLDKVKFYVSYLIDHWDDVVNIFKAIGVPLETINEINKKLHENNPSKKEDLDNVTEEESEVENSYRGNKEIEFVWHGTQSDPELIYKGKSFNYWDIEEGLWENFLEDSKGEWSAEDSEKAECEEAFNKYVQENGSAYLQDCIDGECNESLTEGLNDIQLDTDTEHISIHSEKKTSGEEMIAPLDFQDANEIVDAQEEDPTESEYLDDVETESDAKDISTEDEATPEVENIETTEVPAEEDEFVDKDIDEIDEKSLDDLGESYFNKVYNNVKSYKTESFREVDGKIICEGVITFKSGNQRPTQFILEGNTIDAQGNCTMLVENAQITPGNKAFTLSGKFYEGLFVPESMSYNYLSEGMRFRGNVSLTEARPDNLRSGGRLRDYDDDYVDPRNVDYSKLPGTISYAVLKYAKELGRCNWPSEMVKILDDAFEETGVPDTEANRKFMLSLRQKAAEEREDPRMPGRAKNIEDAMHYVFTLYTAGADRNCRSSVAGIKHKIGTDYTSGDTYDAAHHRTPKKTW